MPPSELAVHPDSAAVAVLGTCKSVRLGTKQAALPKGIFLFLQKLLLPGKCFNVCLLVSSLVSLLVSLFFGGVLGLFLVLFFWLLWCCFGVFFFVSRRALLDDYINACKRVFKLYKKSVIWRRHLDLSPVLSVTYFLLIVYF